MAKKNLNYPIIAEDSKTTQEVELPKQYDTHQ